MPPGDAATRPLLPRPEPAQGEQADFAESPNDYGLPRKRCDGHRPQCHSCRRHGFDCTYKVSPSELHVEALRRDNIELQRRFDVLLESQSILGKVYSILQSLPESEAAAVLGRIRAGADPESILHHVEDGNLLLQLGLDSGIQYRFEFPWRKKMPSFLPRSGNPYLRSRVYEGLFLQDGLPQPDRLAHLEPGYPQYCNPFEAAELIEPRIDEISPSSWTLASDNDNLMRAILHAFLKYEYGWMTAFHIDDFLDDMLIGATDFCSSLLVNAVLTLGCLLIRLTPKHCYRDIPHRAEFWDPSSLSYRFAAETKRLWELEQYSEASLPTVQTAMILSTLYLNFGLDKLADAYLVQGIAMAHRLDLFAPLCSEQSRREQRSRSLTAWSLFWLQSTKAYHFMDTPLLENPPKQPLPDQNIDPGWYGELKVQYPDSEAYTSLQHPSTFKAKVEFNVHLNGMAHLLFPKYPQEKPLSTIQTFSEFAAKLGTWYNSLPVQLSASEIVFPSQFRIHMHYQHIMIQVQETLFPGAVGLRPKMPKLADALPIPGLPSPAMCLETLIRLNYLRHGFEGADMMCVVWLQYIAFAAIRQLRDIAMQKRPPSPGAPYGPDPAGPGSTQVVDELRSSLILVAKGLHDQGRNYQIAATVFELVQASMSEQDRCVLNGILSLGGRERNGASRKGRGRGDMSGSVDHKLAILTKSRYPVNIVKPTDDPEPKRLGILLKEMLL